MGRLRGRHGMPGVGGDAGMAACAARRGAAGCCCGASTVGLRSDADLLRELGVVFGLRAEQGSDALRDGLDARVWIGDRVWCLTIFNRLRRPSDTPPTLAAACDCSACAETCRGGLGKRGPFLSGNAVKPR